ncbi:MAG: hypothetical protein KGJ56_08950 [Gammaproteobacteria bacterium]|nr:hypothetical protein [Gammaproteobacteria bacterium]
MMGKDADWSLARAGWLASANYPGYLLRALPRCCFGSAGFICTGIAVARTLKTAFIPGNLWVMLRPCCRAQGRH